MSALNDLPEFCRRVKDAALKGYQVALGDHYAAELSAEAGVTGYGGSAADLVKLAEAVLAQRAGKATDLEGGEAPLVVVEPELDEEPGTPEDVGPEPEVSEVADTDPPPAPEEGYESWTKDELYAEAQRRNLEGRSGLSKAKLIELLEEDDAGQAPVVPPASDVDKA